MKNILKKIALMLVISAMLVSSLSSCGNGSSTTTGGQATLPPIGGTTGGIQTLPPIGGTTGTTGTTSTPATTGTTVTPPAGNYINPLTGEATSYSASGKRPVAIVVDNAPASYAHQKGLAQADILYEALVAPSITRFLMVVSNYSAITPICNVRSARIYHIDLAGSHNAVLVAHNGETWNNFVSIAAQRLGGGWDTSLQKNLFGYINTKEEYAFGTAEGGQKYGTIKEYDSYYVARTDLKYDTLVTANALIDTLASKTSLFNLSGASISGDASSSLKFVSIGTQKVLAGASPAARVDLHFTLDNHSGSKDVYYTYDASSGKYLRFQDGRAHRDSATDDQLSFTNLIALFTDVTNNQSGLSEDPNVASVKTDGSGIGYYFYGGQAIKINWSKSAWNSQLMLTTVDGTELTLACGNTYIAYLDNTNISTNLTFN